jgi:disulfide bond formation protein DsbB
MSADEDPLLLFCALLAVLCQVFVAVAVIVAVAGAVSPAVRVRRREIARAFEPIAAPFAFAIALVTMSGSLYLSEVKHYLPCHLCWAQRAFLYPQVLLFALLSWKRGLQWARRTSLVLLVGDIPISTYHYLLQNDYFDLQKSSTCEVSNPCSERYFDFFGYISEPLMALSAAAAMLTLLVIHKRLIARELLVAIAASIATFCIIVIANGPVLLVAPVALLALGAMALLDRRRVPATSPKE